VNPASFYNAGLRRSLFGAASLAAVVFLCPCVQALEIKQVPDTGGNSVTLELKGKFEPGDGLKFRAEVAKLPAETAIAVHFNAAGGSFNEGMSIGRFIHQLGIKTVIPPKAHCLSPCPLAFFAGSDGKGGMAAVKHTAGSLGFTPFLPNAQDRDYTAKDLDAEVAHTQQRILQAFDYLLEIGADADILRRIYDDIPEGRVNYVSDDELLGFGVSIYNDASNELIDGAAIRKRKQR